MAQSSKRTKKKVDYQLLNSIGRNNESVQDIDLDLSQFITKDNNAETSFQENISVTTPTATNDAPKIKHKYENSTDSSDSEICLRGILKPLCWVSLLQLLINKYQYDQMLIRCSEE